MKAHLLWQVAEAVAHLHHLHLPSVSHPEAILSEAQEKAVSHLLEVEEEYAHRHRAKVVPQVEKLPDPQTVEP